MTTPSYDEVLAALIQVADVLEALRRGHGCDVSAACYPALNVARDVIARYRVDNNGNLVPWPNPTERTAPDGSKWVGNERHGNGSVQK
jgi:hypothetical protein